MLGRQRAVFVGAARDCAAHLPGVLQNLEGFAASYAEASFLFLVSDCADDSRSILERWLATGRRGLLDALATDQGGIHRTVPGRGGK